MVEYIGNNIIGTNGIYEIIEVRTDKMRLSVYRRPIAVATISNDTLYNYLCENKPRYLVITRTMEGVTPYPADTFAKAVQVADMLINAIPVYPQYTPSISSYDVPEVEDLALHQVFNYAKIKIKNGNQTIVDSLFQIMRMED
jgi:hypothetical protein